MTTLISLKREVINLFFFQIALVTRIIRAIISRLKLILFYQTSPAIKAFPVSLNKQARRPRIFAIIAHIVSPEEASDEVKAAKKIDRLKHTIDGLLYSFSHCDLVIDIHSLPNRNIFHFLPKYQQERVRLRDHCHCDPMYIGFTAQDEFVGKQNDFDWFLFIEDDIVINDSFLIEKLTRFNQICRDDRIVLLPHRYEMWDGVKYYIDLLIDSELAWDKLSVIEIDNIKYTECTNPHSGFYCLSQSQLKRWIRSGQTWKYKEIMVGPLESAATFSLMECFSLYKPHPENLNFLEIKHHDIKYSKQFPEPSPYILSSASKHS